MEKSEGEVAVYMKKLGIKYLYEQPIFVWDENRRPRVWTPDFYLPDLGLYVEVCGSKDFDYGYRKKIYEKNGLSIVFVHWYKDKSKWQEHLKNMIKDFTGYRHKKVRDIIKMFITEKNIKLELEKIKRRVEEIHYCVECGNVCKGDYYYCPYCGFTIM